MRTLTVVRLGVAGLMVVALALSAGALAQDKKKDDKKKAEPKLFVALPLGATPGKTEKLTLRGLNLDNATEVRLEGAKGTIKIVGKGKAGVPDKNPDRVGDTQVEIEITLDKDTKGPSAKVVVVTPDGATSGHPILIETELPLTTGKEPNEGFKEAMELKVPTVVEGKIDRPKDVEVFRFTAKKGQKVRIELLASRFGSPLDGMLTLFNEKVQQLAFNDDFDAAHRDAKIEWVAPHDGIYFLSLIDAHDSGSAIHVYRLVVR